MTRECSVCKVGFEAQRSTARYCSDRCRQRAKRGVNTSSGGDSLVEAVTRELTRAGAADTYAGQLALELARQLTSPGVTGISSLSKELRTVMAAALEHTTPPKGEDGDPEGEDIVDEVRKRREQRQASAAAC